MTETRAKKLAILTYVLETACMTDKAIASLKDDHEINSIADIEANGKENFAALKDLVTTGTMTKLKNIFQWIIKYRKTHDMKLPVTIEEWKEAFTENYDDLLSDYGDAEPQVPSKKEVVVKKEGDDASEISNDPFLKNTKINFRMQDYPLFAGTHDDWERFRTQFEAAAELSGFEDLLNITELEEHKTKFESDVSYKTRVRELYNILKLKCSRGLAMARVFKYQATHDGVMTWQDLKDFYDLRKHKSAKCTHLMDRLQDLKLQFNSHGGMEGYLTEFENICDKLAENGNPLNEEVKKSVLLKNIEDTWYEPWIATCNRLDYEETLNELRAAALRNGKYNKSKSRFERRNVNFKKTTEENVLYFPFEVWNKMSLEARKFIIEYREKLKRGEYQDTTFKKQYDKDNPEEENKSAENNDDKRKQNSKKTKEDNATKDKEQEKEEHPYASLFKKHVINPTKYPNPGY